MDWVWRRIASAFISALVLPRTGARHSTDAMLVSVLTPPQERAAVRAVSSATATSLTRLAHASSVWVRAAVADRADLSPTELAWIARVSYRELRRGWRTTANPDSPAAIALRNALVHPSTPPIVLAQFAGRRNRSGLWMTQAVASNPKTPAEVLGRLSRHPDPAIRWTIAGNAATPSQAVEILSESDDLIVKWFLARHHRVDPSSLVRWMAQDRWVAFCAAHGPNVGDVVTRSAVLEPDVRLAAARNPETNPLALAAWSDDVTADMEGRSLAGALAANPNTPTDACTHLVRRVGASTIARSLLHRADVNEAIMDAILDGDHSWTRPAPWERFRPVLPPLPHQAVERLVTEKTPEVRAYLARSAGLDGPVQRTLAADVSAQVRRAVVGNPTVDDTIARQLIGDTDPAVADAARARFAT